MAKGTNKQKPSKKTSEADSDDKDDSSYATAQSKKSEEANDQVT